MNKDEITTVDIAELMKPKDGFICLLNRYWIVQGQRAVFLKTLLSSGVSPCAFHDEMAANMFVESKYNRDNHFAVVFIPLAYVPNE